MANFQRRSYSGGGTTTTLAGSMASTDMSFTISADTGWPGSPAADFFVVIDRGTASEEKVLCASNSGTTVTVASSGRGGDGTSAAAHNANATVSLCGVGLDFDDANQISHLLGNLAAGSLVQGAGSGTIPTELTVGTSGQYLKSSGTAAQWETLTIPPALTPTAQSSTYSAVNGDYVIASDPFTLTSPAAASGARFGVYVNYAASSGSPLTISAASGSFYGPLAPAGASAVLITTAATYAEFVSDGTNWYQSSGASTYAESYLSGSSLSLPADTATDVTSVVLRPGTWLIAARLVVVCNNATAPQIGVWIGPTSNSNTGAYASTSVAFNVSESGQKSCSIMKIVTLSAQTTVYLEATSSQAGTIEYEGYESNVANCTGISAVLIS